MKINIAVCDDEQIEIEYVTSLTQKWSNLRQQPVTLTPFHSAESFLFHYSGNQNLDILLLDIQMGGQNGIDLARQIRQRQDDSLQIIFITGYSDFIADGYDVSALHYLMKPVKEEKLFEVLDKAVSRLHAKPRTILLSVSDGTIRIKADEIIYAEVFSHTVTLHLTTGRKDLRIRISDLESLLGDSFFKCHRSYIVSMRYTKLVTRKAMVLEDGTEIPLSRNLYDDAIQAFIKYN